jgi:hypothetical protein
VLVSLLSILILAVYLAGAVFWAVVWGIELNVGRAYPSVTAPNKMRRAARMLLAFPAWPILLFYLLGQALWRVAKIAFGKGAE